MSYPSTIDSFTTHTNGDTIDPSYDNAQQTALIALQTKLGIDSSADTTSIDYKVKSTSALDVGHKHSLSVSIADVLITSLADTQVLQYSAGAGKWINGNPSAQPDASTTVKGLTKLSVAPVSATIPIAVGDNDTRVPTTGQTASLVGNNIDIAVGSGNKMVTQTGLQKNAEKYGADAVGTDSYAITLSPVPTSYATGMVVHFKAGTANTGASTLNVNALGAKTLKRDYNVDTDTGDILANQMVTVIYDGINFQIISPLPTKTYNVTATVSASTTTTITSGFRPKIIKITALNGNTNYGVTHSTGTYSVAQGTYALTGMNYASAGNTFSAGVNTSNIINIAYSTGSTTVTATISNITGTGFDLVSTVAGSGVAYCMIEVIG